MSATEFPLNDPLAREAWSTSLAVEAEVKQYFSRFMGDSDSAVIRVKKELQKSAGDKVTVALRMKLAGDGVEGDNTIEGTSAEEHLDFFSDKLTIDQRRKGTKSKGRMSEQRVPYNMRKEGHDALSTWWAEDMDQMCFMYQSGARGINADFHVPLAWTGRADNALQAPDAAHLIMPTTKTKATLLATDVLTIGMVERLVSKAETLDPMMLPIMINGMRKFVLLMHTFQAYDLRTSTTANDWLDIHKAVDRGPKALMYKNALGEYADVVLHKHRSVVRFSDYGSGGNIAAARALFLGAQAGIIAWGGGGGKGRYTWNEDKDDRGNALAITAGTIVGNKKSRFNSKDFGTIAVDTAAADPA